MAFKRKPPAGNVRRVVSIGKNCRGITTNKCGRLVQFESDQERKLILVLERDATVRDFCSQPEIFSFSAPDGRRSHYTPDFQVWRTDGQIELHEVTLAARRQIHAGVPPREGAAQALCQQRGWRYLVHTDQTLPVGYEYANLDCLSAFRAAIYADSRLVAWWRDHLAGHGYLHPHTILLHAAPEQDRGRLVSTLSHLLWHNVIQMDWHRPLFWCDDFHPTAQIWLSAAPRLTQGGCA